MEKINGFFVLLPEPDSISVRIQSWKAAPYVFSEKLTRIWKIANIIAQH